MKIENNGRVSGKRHGYVHTTVNQTTNEVLTNMTTKLDYISTLNGLPLDGSVCGRSLICEIYRRMMACQ